jgi:hypothetical protein
MPRKPIDLPSRICSFLAEENHTKRDEIAIRPHVALNEHLGKRQRPLRVTDMKEMYLHMKDQA